MVSKRLSPLVVEEVLMFRLMTSADKRLAAISKVVRVRVEFSKNRLNTDLPRNSGTLLDLALGHADERGRRIENVREDRAR